MSENINISNIETYLYGLLKGTDISKHIVVGESPLEVDKGWEDFVVIEVYKSKNYDAYGIALAYILLYAHPLANGTKNVKRLCEMEHELDNILLNSNTNIYNINKESTRHRFNNNIKWHCNEIQLNIHIN